MLWLWLNVTSYVPKHYLHVFSDRGWYLVVDLLVLSELIHVRANFGICKKYAFEACRILRCTEYLGMQNTLNWGYFPRVVGAIAFQSCGTEGSCVGKYNGKLTLPFTDWFGLRRYYHILKQTTAIYKHRSISTFCPIIPGQPTPNLLGDALLCTIRELVPSHDEDNDGDVYNVRNIYPGSGLQGASARFSFSRRTT